MNVVTVTPANDDSLVVARPAHHLALTHAGVPLLLLIVGSAVLMAGNGDQHLANLLYRLEGGHWALRDSWITSSLIHHDGKHASIALGIGFLLAGMLGSRVARLRPLRPALFYVVTAVATSTLAVSLLKSLTHMDCPWDLQAYGGPRPFIGLFESRHGLPASGCFPAGHASAGYAWLALYFFALAVRPAWRWPMLAVGLGMGLVFGIAQQLRGAHFLSHDLWTAAICWFVALGLYRAWPWKPATSSPPAPREARA